MRPDHPESHSDLDAKHRIEAEFERNSERFYRDGYIRMCMVNILAEYDNAIEEWIRTVDPEKTAIPSLSEFMENVENEMSFEYKENLHRGRPIETY